EKTASATAGCQIVFHFWLQKRQLFAILNSVKGPLQPLVLEVTPMEFQQRLYDLRKKAGLSQEGLADLLGVTRQAVQKWEAGASRPDMDNLAALARYF